MHKILIIIIALLALGATDCKKKPSMPDIVKKAASMPSGAVAISTNSQQRTTKGAHHHGFKDLSQAQLDLIDIGIDQLYASAIADGFKPEARKEYSWFVVSTPPLPCIPSPVSRTPSFVINGGPYYDGTEWDQYNTKGVGVPDGISVIFAAEMVLSIGTEISVPNYAWMYVCPDTSVLVNAVRYGGDHAFLANFPYTEKYRTTGPYDGYAWFNATIVHGPGHPLLPRPASALEGGFEEMVKLPEGREVEGSKDLADAFGVGEVKWVTGQVTRPAR